jgi:ABC-type hemin transport system substrate-binding protein
MQFDQLKRREFITLLGGAAACGDAKLIKAHAAELVALAPDLILTGLTPAVQALKRETRTLRP